VRLGVRSDVTTCTPDMRNQKKIVVQPEHVQVVKMESKQILAAIFISAI